MRNDACLGPGTAVQFEYDHNGLRTKKTVTESGVTTVTEYRLHGSMVTHLTRGTDSLHFYYDAASQPAFVDYNGTLYAYVHNLQGDIVGILDSTGALVVTYGYDAWGKPVQTNGSMVNTLGKINPFRYRGYVFDEETELYYLQHRYYDPVSLHWIISDNHFDEDAGVLGSNLYVYCANNPISLYDPDGSFVISTMLVCVLVGAFVGGVVGGIIGNHYASTKGYVGWDKTKHVLRGITVGIIAGGVIGYVAAPVIAHATGIAGISISSSGVSTIATVGTTFGKMGMLIYNDGRQIIDWGRTTYHGMQQMMARGVTRSMVELWVKTGKALQQTGEKVIYITRQGAVVVDKLGRVITAYTSQYYDDVMKKVIERLFGK